MRRNNEKGVALLTVIAALMALMVIAVPFAITMRLSYERSETTRARKLAERKSDSLLRLLESYVARTTERIEKVNRDSKSVQITQDPEVDTIAEIMPSEQDIADALGLSPKELRDPYGQILGWNVTDENAKLNLNSASFFALGNLMGLSVLSGDLSPSDQSIELEDASRFPDRGYVMVGRELVKYGKRSGNRLEDCERQMLSGEPRHGTEEKYPAGHWVVNYAAWAISYYPILKHPAEYSPFQSLDVSDILSLEKLDAQVPVLTRADWERIKPFVTIFSKGEVADGWANVQTVLDGNALPIKKAGKHDHVRTRDTSRYNLGTIVRIAEKAETNLDEREAYKERTTHQRPRKHDYLMVNHAYPSGESAGRIEFFGKAHRDFVGNQMRVEYLNRQPVNINTASPEVLHAIFTNLQLKLRERVTPAAAAAVADEIIRRRKTDKPVRSMRDFKRMLDDVRETGKLTLLQMSAIYRNGLNSHDQGLVFGTVPVCFRTFDVYTLQATVTIHDRGGHMLAKHSGTRVVEIGSPVTTVKEWETQRDFEQQLIATANPRFFSTGPFKMGFFQRDLINPYLRWPTHLGGNRFPYDPYEMGDRENRPFRTTSETDTNTATNGDVRLRPARDDYTTSPLLPRFYDGAEHFDQDTYIEGKFVTGGEPTGLKSKVLDALASNGQPEAFSIQFWWRTEGGSNETLFDYGEDTFRNRYHAFVDTDAGDIVFAIADNTDTARACEVRYPLELLGGELGEQQWYHFHFIAAGCHPSKMTMLVDGRAADEHNLLGTLSGTVNTTSTTVRVDDADGFPAVGAIMVGNEVMEYESHTSTSFTIRRNSAGDTVGRGARGTPVLEHENGAPVVLFGYSRPLVSDLTIGGATLDGELGPWSPVQLDTETDGANTPPFEGYEPLTEPDQGAQINFYVIPGQTLPDGSTGLATNVEIWSVPVSSSQPFSGATLKIVNNPDDADETIEDQMEAFQQDGYCLVMYIGGTRDDIDALGSGDSSGIEERLEYMRYEKSDLGLTLFRLDDNDGAQSAPELDAEYEILVGMRLTGGRQFINPAPPGAFGFRMLIAPVSVRSTTVGDDAYLNPVDEDNMLEWVVQLKSTDDSADQPWEWVRYSEVLSVNGATYFLQARVASETAMLDSMGFDSYAELIRTILLPGGVGATPEPADPPDDPEADPGGEPPEDDPGGGDGPPTAPPPDAPDDGGSDAPSGGDGPIDTPEGGDDEGGSDAPGGDDAPQDEPEGGPDEPGSDAPTGDDGPIDEPQGGPDEGGSDAPSGDDAPQDEPEGGPDDPGSDLPPDEDPDGGGGDGGGGDGEDPPDDEDDPDPGPGPIGTLPPDDGAIGTAEVWANIIRHRGVQADFDSDGLVDDWPKGDDNSVHADGALLVPVYGTYGGPDPTQADVVAGEDFAIWPRPGFGDQIDLVSGDDEVRIGGDLTAWWSINAESSRLRDPATPDVEVISFNWWSHLVANDEQVNERFRVSEDLDPRVRDFREYTRLLCTPSGEMPDNDVGFSAATIGKDIDGNTTPAVIDEIIGFSRPITFRLAISDEDGINEEADTIRVISAEGIPDDADVPDGPGVIKIGAELVVFEEAALNGSAIEFTGCIRGTLRTEAAAYGQGTEVEPLFSILVGVIDEAVQDSSNNLRGLGFDHFPASGVVRLENGETDQAELRLYTTNTGNVLQMPINDKGGGIFVGRYGGPALPFPQGTAVFYQSVRVYDRYTDFSDDPELAFFSFSTRLTDAYIKRVFWDEEITAEHLNIRVLARLGDVIDWNAREEWRNYLSMDGTGSSESAGLSRMQKEGASPLKQIFVMENPNGDNWIGLQAEKIQIRAFVIFYTGAYEWADPSKFGWKYSPKLRSMAVEYVQNNRIRRHVDK